MTVTETCSCDDGWRYVSERWVEHEAPWPDPPDDDASEAVLAEYAFSVEQTRLKRAALANTVYPCKRCRRQLFYRWAGGHLHPGHERTHCEQCQDVRRGRAVDVEPVYTVPDEPNPEHETRRDVYQ